MFWTRLFHFFFLSRWWKLLFTGIINLVRFFFFFFFFFLPLLYLFFPSSPLFIYPSLYLFSNLPLFLLFIYFFSYFLLYSWLFTFFLIFIHFRLHHIPCHSFYLFIQTFLFIFIPYFRMRIIWFEFVLSTHTHTHVHKINSSWLFYLND